MITAELRQIQTGIMAAAEYLDFGFEIGDEGEEPLDAGGGRRDSFESSMSLELWEREESEEVASLSSERFSRSMSRDFSSIVGDIVAHSIACGDGGRCERCRLVVSSIDDISLSG
jgi:hypothetical protein